MIWLLVLPFLSAFIASMQCTLTMENLQVLFRHGRRSPERYAWHDQHDDYFNTHGLGQLTPPGRQDLFQLGSFLRSLYHTFIGDNPHKVDFISTGVDRTLESAECLSAGLLPPVGPFRWNSDLNWQPKAIYISKTQVQNVTALESYQDLLENSSSAETKSQLKDLLSDLSRTTGRNLTRYYDIFWFYDQAVSERGHGFDLPDWVASYMGRIMDVTRGVLGNFCDHLEEIKPYYEELLQDVLSYFQETQSSRGKFYASHDIHLSVTLCKLGYKVQEQVPFGASIIFQLHKSDDKKYVRVFYNDSPNHDVMKPLNLTGCADYCPLEDFEKLLS